MCRYVDMRYTVEKSFVIKRVQSNGNYKSVLLRATAITKI
jgi:hypothetical protein